MKITLGRAALLALFSALAGAVGAQEAAPPSSIQVTGEATLTTKPEEAQIDVGVVTQASTANEAARRNAQALDAVLSSIRGAVGAQARFETSSYSLNPNYRYPRDGGEPTVTGYTATNVLRVTHLALDEVGKVIDLAAGSGANTIRGVSFTLKDPEKMQARALREAAEKAKQKAEVLADALGVRIVRILSVKEGGTAVILPRRETYAMAARAQAVEAPTPVEPGDIEIRASVSLVVEIAP